MQTTTGETLNAVPKLYRWGLVATAVFMFMCLLFIHAASYIFVRNIGADSLSAGYTGYTVSNTIFQDDVGEFISLGFLILPVVLLFLVFWADWFDKAMCLVALVFSTINLVAIFFRTIGAIVAQTLDNSPPGGGAGYCSNPVGIFPNAYCTAQRLLVAGLLLLLISQVIIFLLALKSTLMTKYATLVKHHYNAQGVATLPVPPIPSAPATNV